MSILYIAGVSISGDINNISPITKEKIASANLIIGEEKKSLTRLLNGIGVSKKSFLLLNEHSTYNDKLEIFNEVLKAEVTVFVSDSGTPCISDPDWHFVSMCQKGGIKVKSLPGASSIVAGLSVSGINSEQFLFAGFPPKKGRERLNFFRNIEKNSITTIFMERPYSLKATLEDLKFIERPISVSINLGDDNEVNLYGKAVDIIKNITNIKAPFVIVVSGKEKILKYRNKKK